MPGELVATRQTVTPSCARFRQATMSPTEVHWYRIPGGSPSLRPGPRHRTQRQRGPVHRADGSLLQNCGFLVSVAGIQCSAQGGDVLSTTTSE